MDTGQILDGASGLRSLSWAGDRNIGCRWEMCSLPQAEGVKASPWLWTGQAVVESCRPSWGGLVASGTKGGESGVVCLTLGAE